MRFVIEYSCDQGPQALLDRSFGGGKTGLGFAFLRSVMDTCILLGRVIRRHGKPAYRGQRILSHDKTNTRDSPVVLE